MNMKRRILLLFLWVSALCLQAQDASLLHRRIDPILQRVAGQPDWLFSRLQMYWTTHATDVFVRGETFDHPGGQRAPVPTVKYNGTRGTASLYNRPALEDVVPYDDDSLGNVTFVNRATSKMEKAHPSKTGCNIDGLNRQILGLAADAAQLYALEGDRRCAQLAFGVFDTFMRGIYHRNVPVDLNHGHQQTLVGMTTFEVIHEEAITPLVKTYQLLGKYIRKDRDLYDAAFKKWADNIIANGVPHNNWDLLQAEFVAKIAQVLQPDKHYADGHGCEYYLDCIVERSSIRQWGLKPLADFGFDSATGIWYEAPGYSQMVVGDFCAFADALDREAGIDVFRRLPVLRKAVFSLPQYLFPNRMIAGFGDTHPGYLSTKAVDAYAAYAVRHHDEATVSALSRLKAALQPAAADTAVARYVSPIFHAKNVSWLALRSGMNRQHDLMVSLNGSLGNHQHANGISMELYGKGWVLGPDAGIGEHLYSGLDYQEYYSQMPAHNTVCVDGVSSYPVMMSQHAFTVVDSGQVSLPDDTQALFSVVAFVEPETQSDQQRTNAVVKTSDKGGFYVDIFRSRRRDGNDKFHDYFYHNLGQKMTLTAADGSGLGLQSTNELAFAGGHLYAYSYLYDKRSAQTSADVKASFVLTPTNKNALADPDNPITMTLWMRGDSAREVFSALSPVNREYERMKEEPYDIDRQPVLTYVARQRGEAWTHPFVAVYEPSSASELSEIAQVSFFSPQSADPTAVGIRIDLKDGRTRYVFSSADGSEMSYRNMTVKGRCVVM